MLACSAMPVTRCTAMAMASTGACRSHSHPATNSACWLNGVSPDELLRRLAEPTHRLHGDHVRVELKKHSPVSLVSVGKGHRAARLPPPREEAQRLPDVTLQLSSTDLPTSPPYHTRRLMSSDSDEDECDEHAPILCHAGPRGLANSNNLSLPPLSDFAHCPVHVIDTRPSSTPPLLDVAPAVRSLIWQYMDNSSAVHYLSTCSRLYELYHSFPLTEPISNNQLRSLVARTTSFRRR